jgi:hypothetical protein
MRHSSLSTTKLCWCNLSPSPPNKAPRVLRAPEKYTLRIFPKNSPSHSTKPMWSCKRILYTWDFQIGAAAAKSAEDIPPKGMLCKCTTYSRHHKDQLVTLGMLARTQKYRYKWIIPPGTLCKSGHVPVARFMWKQDHLIDARETKRSGMPAMSLNESSHVV